MSGPTFHEAVEVSFDTVAVQVDGAEEKAIHKPGVEGLHVFLEGCRGDAPRSGVSADVVSVESLKKVFEEKGWPHDLSFKREDLATLLESLGVPESEEEDLSYDISDLVDQIHDRAAAKEFPLLRPMDLPGEDEQSAAEQSLGLVEKMDAVKVQSYIDFQKQQYFESSPGDPATSIEEKHARWALRFYYKHVRDFLSSDSLDAKKFAHRFSGSTFIPLIPPQSIGDEEKKRVAVDASSSMRPEFLESLDSNLWSAWEEIAEAVELSDADVHDSFRVFLEEDYFRIARETCDAGAAAGAEMRGGPSMLFQPMVILLSELQRLKRMRAKPFFGRRPRTTMILLCRAWLGNTASIWTRARLRRGRYCRQRHRQSLRLADTMRCCGSASENQLVESLGRVMTT